MQRFISFKNRLFRSVTTRLTFFHLVLFGLSSLVVFVLIHLSLSYTLLELTDKYLRDEIKEEENLFNVSGIKKLQQEFFNESLGGKRFSVFYLLLSPQKKILVSSDLQPWKGFSLILQGFDSLKEGDEIIQTLPRPGSKHKVRVINKKIQGGLILEIGKSLKDNDEILESVRKIFGYGFLSMFTLGTLLGWIISKRAMAGVERVTNTAIQIDRGDLSRRVPIGKEGEEIKALAQAFNNMLDRIQLLVEDLERVTSNIAHDLRSPLTRIRGMAENMLTNREDIHASQEMAGAIIEECDRLVSLINTMLEIAQTDSGLARLTRTPTDILEVIHEAIELFQPAAEDKGILLSARLPDTPLEIHGDKTAIQRVVANLLDNAIKFTDKGGKVVITVKEDSTKAIIEISDTGEGISSENLPHIFERFYRGDKSRSTQGNGLGLSLALSIIRAHGGNIDVTSSPNRGSTFTISLPHEPTN